MIDRKLNAEMCHRLRMAPGIDDTLMDAIHDLDLADRERDEWQTVAEKATNECDRLTEKTRRAYSKLAEAQATIAQFQEKCEKISGLMAEAEAHRTMLMERDTQILELKREVSLLNTKADIAKKLALEILSCKGNTFDINQLAEKVHYALS